ncbi:hypothetical protein MPSEU_000831400 [Mayamaea pseudoterrestris]|nr:hypothetical protein MPSEU_000831400 [Mayamaea pseudoterrestris]
MIACPSTFLDEESTKPYKLQVYEMEAGVTLPQLCNIDREILTHFLLRDDEIIIRLANKTLLVIPNTAEPMQIHGQNGAIYVEAGLAIEAWTGGASCRAFIPAEADRKLIQHRDDYNDILRFATSWPARANGTRELCLFSSNYPAVRDQFLLSDTTDHMREEDVISLETWRACFTPATFAGGKLHLMEFQPSDEQWNVLKYIPFSFISCHYASLSHSFVQQTQTSKLEIYNPKLTGPRRNALFFRAPLDMQYFGLRFNKVGDVRQFLGRWLGVSRTMQLHYCEFSVNSWKEFWRVVDGAKLCTSVVFVNVKVGANEVAFKHLSVISKDVWKMLHVDDFNFNVKRKWVR